MFVVAVVLCPIFLRWVSTACVASMESPGCSQKAEEFSMKYCLEEWLNFLRHRKDCPLCQMSVTFTCYLRGLGTKSTPSDPLHSLKWLRVFLNFLYKCRDSLSNCAAISIDIRNIKKCIYKKRTQFLLFPAWAYMFRSYIDHQLITLNGQVYKITMF